MRSLWAVVGGAGRVNRSQSSSHMHDAAALHRQMVELHRTGRQWGDRHLDLDAAVEVRAQEIDREWFGAIQPDMTEEHRRPGFYLVTPLKNEDPRYPFQQIVFANESSTGVLALVAPFYAKQFYRAETARGLFWRLKQRGHVIIGISSYRFFPQPSDDPAEDRFVVPEDREIYEAVDGWLHCFRDPDRMLPAGVPRMLWSESDGMDPFLGGAHRSSPGIFGMRAGEHPSLVPREPGRVRKQYDLIYSNLGGLDRLQTDWNDYNRNWTLAKPAIINLIRELNLTILVVGRNLEDEPELRPFLDSGKLVSKPKAFLGQFLHLIEASRALWTPNVADASPRVLTQALCKNVPILVNRHIAGGWKYVNHRTGVFFSDEHDVVEAARHLFSQVVQAQLTPREYYLQHFGAVKAAMRLQAFVELAVECERLERARRLVAGEDVDA